MDKAFTDPARLAAHWHLALSTRSGQRRATRVSVADRALLLLPLDAEGWWALDAGCGRCGQLLPLPAGDESVTHVTCDACRLAHEPASGKAAGPPVMLVDDEVYVFLG